MRGMDGDLEYTITRLPDEGDGWRLRVHNNQAAR